MLTRFLAVLSFASQRVQYAGSKSDASAKAEGESALEENRAQRKRKREEGSHDMQAGDGPAAKKARVEDETPPHNILFVVGLPEAATVKLLTSLFQQYPGFCEASLVPSKPGIAFVEYTTVQQAADAMRALNGFVLPPEHRIGVTFAKQ